MAEPKFKTDSLGNPLEIHGERIVINDQVVKHSFKRSWLERLFTWPFRPFKRYNTITQKVVPDNQYYYSPGKVVMNSVTYQKLEHEVKKGGFV